MTTVDVVNWVVHTPWYIRLIRAALGVGIGFTLTHASKWILGAKNIEQSQQLTEFFFDQALPYLIVGLFLFGPYVVLCEKVGLSKGPSARARAARLQPNPNLLTLPTGPAQ